MDLNYREECGREGVGRMEWREGGGKWDNCNSIINKYIKKKRNSLAVVVACVLRLLERPRPLAKLRRSL